MKLNGIVNLYQACYDALERLKGGSGDQATAFNGFAWYSADKEAVEDGAVPVATVTMDEDGQGHVGLWVSDLLSTQERKQMVIQYQNAATALGLGLTVLERPLP